MIIKRRVPILERGAEDLPESTGTGNSTKSSSAAALSSTAIVPAVRIRIDVLQKQEAARFLY